jgi:GGDEF domain-containing protein/ActR/RegA family two-component response regulator
MALVGGELDLDRAHLDNINLDRAELDVDVYLRRELVERQDWVLLYADLRYFRAYNQFYGFVAGEQMLKAFQAVLVAQLPADCRCFRVGGDEFLAFSHSDRAEADASAICDRWKQARQSFYNSQDCQRGFLLGNGRHGIGYRCPLVRVCIGLVSHHAYPEPLASIPDICSAAVATNALARSQRKSTYVTETTLQQVLQEEAQSSPARQRALQLWLNARTPTGRVLAIESDAALACLLQVRLELEGYGVQVTSSPREAVHLIAQQQLEVAIVDADSPLATCRYLRSAMPLPDMRLVALTNDADRIAVLEAGADLYVPKPFAMEDLLYWIDRLRQSHLKAVDATPYTARPYSPLAAPAAPANGHSR